MWNEPYLETCCRSALHRLFLSGENGRPALAITEGEFPDFRAPLKDRACLERLVQMKLAFQDGKGRFYITFQGKQRHQLEILSMKHRKARPIL
ncbi:hypothetical protein GT348_01155 [Aristophania vespae]|uniref:Uncharacterized protein n=1 Tax=Aristophania vespae TaxID=2697033 RepID=A0A6P1NHH8_9PROT|nr:hypothetical protein [Aristophania vespae]QHI96327.1 hypothetical protein GT348_01155 [Aristophania vespae]